MWDYGSNSWIGVYGSDFQLSPGDSGFGPDSTEGRRYLGGGYSIGHGNGSDPLRYIFGFQPNVEGGVDWGFLVFAGSAGPGRHGDPGGGGGLQQQRGGYQPLKRGEDGGFGNCFRAQFAAARKAQEQYASENALSLKPSASTVVVAVAVFATAMAFTKQPVLSALASGSVSVAKDVVGDNVVRIGKRIASSVNNEADLNIKLGNCYRERGQEPPGEFLPDSLRAAYGTP